MARKMIYDRGPSIAENLSQVVVMGGALVSIPFLVTYLPGAWDDVPHKQVCIDVDSQGLLDLYEATICAR